MTLASFGHTEFPHLIWRQFNTTTKESIHILLLRHYRLMWIKTSFLTGEDEVKYAKESFLENFNSSKFDIFMLKPPIITIL